MEPDLEGWVVLETEVGERTSSTGYSGKEQGWRRMGQHSVSKGEQRGGVEGLDVSVCAIIPKEVRGNY